jgi:hypothetical protein
MTGWRAQLDADGYAILPGVFTADEVRAVLAEWEEVSRRHAADPAILANDGPPYGARNLLQLWPRVVELARRPALRHPLVAILGPAAGVVRALFFDKPPGHSWALPWHKDYNIAVAAHGPEGAFAKPTTKAGVPHVMAPFELLGRMVTARVHLDDMTADNGPLRALPGSHRHYHQANDELGAPISLHCRAGDVLLMRPLLTHASAQSKPEAGLHRRIVHLECAPGRELPDRYEWHDFLELMISDL